MVRTEVQRDFDVDHGVAGHHARRNGFVDTLFHRRNVLARNHAALDGVDELNAFAWLIGLNFEHHVAILALTAGLTHKLAFGIFHCFANGFAVCHLRLTDVGFHAKLTPHAVDNNFQVQLAHTGNDGLARFFVRLDAEGRIFCSQTLQGNTHFFLVGFGFWLYGLGNHRLREHHALQDDRVGQVAQGFARGHVFQAHASSDVASANFVDFLTLIGVHLHDTADTFFFALDGVHHGVAFFQHTRINAHKGQLADKRVGHQLERQGRELLAVVGFAGDRVVVFVGAFDISDVGRRRQKVQHGVKHALHAFVLERGTAQHRLNFAGNRALTQTSNDFGLRQVTFFKVLVHQLFRGFCSGLDHFLAPLVTHLKEVCGNVAVLELHAL